MTTSIDTLDQDGATLLSGYGWPDAFAGETQTARKFGLENTSDHIATDLTLEIEAITGNDGASVIRLGLDTATVSRPFGLTAALGSAGAGGVWGATGSQYYVLTAINATGQTVASREVTVNVDDTTKKITLEWTLPTGATGIKVYRSTTSGDYASPSLRTSLSTVESFVDDGTACGAGTPPAANTTGGAAPTYGTPPALATTPLSFGDVAEGEQRFYWINRIVPAGTPDFDAFALRRFREH